MSARTQTLWAACIAVAATYACPAAAQHAEAVQLDIEDCAGTSGSEVRALVALELNPQSASAAKPAAPATDARTAAVRGGITCQHETARVWVEDPARATALHLDITLRDLAPRARPRLLALALAELIATSRMQRAQQPTAAGIQPGSKTPTSPAANAPRTTASAAAPQTTNTLRPSAADTTVSVDPPLATGPTASTATQQLSQQASREVEATDAAGALLAGQATPSSPAQPPSFLVWLGAGVTRLAQPTLWAPAVSAGAVQTWDQLALFADVRVDLARRSESDLQLSLTGLSLALGPAWHLSGPSCRWLLGAAVRAGYVRLHATSSETSQLGRALPGFWFGPCVQTALHVPLSESFALRIGLELGYVTQTVRGRDASGAPLLALEGAWLSAHAALSWGTARSTP